MTRKYNSVYDVLELVDQKFSSPDKWTKGSYAKTINGDKCSENDSKAYCHCLAGAVISVTEEKDRPGMADEFGAKTFRLIESLLPSGLLIHVWNDASHRTFDDIKSFIKRAKKKAKNEGI